MNRWLLDETKMKWLVTILNSVAPHTDGTYTISAEYVHSWTEQVQRHWFSLSNSERYPYQSQGNRLLKSLIRTVEAILSLEKES